ncbi:MAG: hypothetical protein R2813_04315 [Flavobacteriales bacterium]
MNTRLTYTVLSFSLLFGACKEFQEPAPDGSDTPVFKLNAMLNGESMNWDVNGVDFKTTSSYSEDALGVIAYEGVIQAKSCAIEACGPRLEVQFRGTEDIDADLKAGNFPFRYYNAKVDSVKQYNVQVVPEVYGDVLNSTWFVDGETYTTDGIQPFSFTKTENDPSIVPVKLVVTFENGCVSEITNNVYLPHHGCDVSIHVTEMDNPQALLYQAIGTGGSGIEYSWSFESGPTASSDEIFYRYNSIPSSGLDRATVTISTDGCTAQNIRQQIVEDSLVTCNVNFSNNIETTTIYSDPSGLTEDLGTIEISYTDEGGNKYINLYTEQPDWAHFEIVDVEDYTDPIVSSNQSSKKITVNFAVRLSNPTLGSIDITNGSVTIPVGLGL